MSSSNVTTIFDGIKNLKLGEVNELCQLIEDEFKVSIAAAAPVAAGGDGGGGAAAAEEKLIVAVKLAGCTGDDKKLSVIKAVRAAVPTLNLIDAKKLVEGSSKDSPALIQDGVKKEEAEKMKKLIEEAGGVVILE